MTRVIAVVNQKGGVGKTATADNLGYGFSQSGDKTLMIDLDPTPNLTSVYGSDFEYNIINVLTDKNFDLQKAIYKAKVNDEVVDNLFIIPSHITLATQQTPLDIKAHREKLLKNQIDKLSRDLFKWIIIDLPPLLTVFSGIGVYAADEIFIPVKYERGALDGIADLFVTLSEIKETQIFDYRILRNAFDERTKVANEFVESALEDFIKKGKVFKTIIRQDSAINNAFLAHMPVWKYAPHSVAAACYRELVKEIKGEENAK